MNIISYTTGASFKLEFGVFYISCWDLLGFADQMPWNVNAAMLKI